MAFRGPYRESGNSITNNQMLSRRFSFHLSLPLSLAKLKESRDALNWAMPLCWPLCILATCVAASEDAVTTCHQLGCCVGVSLSEMIQRFIEINNFSFKFNLLCSQQSPLTHNYSINRSSKYIRYQLSKYDGFYSHYLSSLSPLTVHYIVTRPPNIFWYPRQSIPLALRSSWFQGFSL